jgi:hypothetical protein
MIIEAADWSFLWDTDRVNRSRDERVGVDHFSFSNFVTLHAKTQSAKFPTIVGPIPKLDNYSKCCTIPREAEGICNFVMSS